MPQDYTHPITPPPELVTQWLNDYYVKTFNKPLGKAFVLGGNDKTLAASAAQWGADQELEACCEWLENQPQWMEDLRAARRPKPPSLREQALEAAQRFYANGHDDCSDAEVLDDFNTIRRALEQLPDPTSETH